MYSIPSPIFSQLIQQLETAAPRVELFENPEAAEWRPNKIPLLYRVIEDLVGGLIRQALRPIVVVPRTLINDEIHSQPDLDDCAFPLLIESQPGEAEIQFQKQNRILILFPIITIIYLFNFWKQFTSFVIQIQIQIKIQIQI